MKLNWVLGMVGLCTGLMGQSALAADPPGYANIPFDYLQPVTPPSALPQPTPPRPVTPTQPGTAQPSTQSPTLAPVTDTFSQAPRTGAMVTPGFQPYMVGDLGLGGSLAKGVAFVPGLVQRPSTPGGGGGGTSPGLVARNLPLPALGRGAFKIQENESPRPVDRFFATYNYFNGIGSGIPGFPTFDLHRQTFGFEKTFLDGDASIGMRLNTLQAAGDGSLRSNDFGDMTIISKFALINNVPAGNVLSVGLAVTAPTGPDLILEDGSRLNPVLIQPYTGFIYVMDKLFAQGFSALVIPTDDRDVYLSTGSLGLGYNVFQAACPDDVLISYITPVIEGHATIPLNHRGSNNSPTGFPDLFILTNGVNIGLGRSANLLLGVAVPLTGPKLFDIEGIAALNYRF